MRNYFFAPLDPRLEATAVVVLNALGYIGFKVVTTCGDSKVRNFRLKEFWCPFFILLDEFHTRAGSRAFLTLKGQSHEKVDDIRS
jgi:hypothetical protein